MKWYVAVVVSAACGGSPRSEATAAKPDPQPTTCTDAATILRGPLATDDAKAGPARELAIAQACRDDRWAPEVLACVASSRTPGTCVDQLTAPQRAAYDEKLAGWQTIYSGD